MKKYLLMLMILTLAFLAGCTEVNVDYLKLELNPGVDTIELDHHMLIKVHKPVMV
jgi:hypothetical protein